MEEDLNSISDHKSERQYSIKVKETNHPEGIPVMSKKQIKKLIKKEKWESEKMYRRKEKREKQKEKRKQKRLIQKLEQKPVLDQPLNGQTQQMKALMRKRKQDYAQKMKEGLRVIIDLQFYDLMSEKEQASLIKQLSHCHSVNRKSQKCFNYILTSATGQYRQKQFAVRYNADKWGIQMNEKSLIDIYPRQKLVYLTGDAEEDIEHFDPELIYIIGGIVDHNRLKRITYNYAIENKIVAKRLPMKHVKLKASVHLAVNHVWQWMLKSYNGVGWDDALKSVLPLRKLQTYTDE